MQVSAVEMVLWNASIAMAFGRFLQCGTSIVSYTEFWQIP
jgi:hypothetical protein